MGYRYTSVFKNFLKISIIIIFSIILLALWFTKETYLSERIHTKDLLFSAAQKVDSLIEGDLEYTKFHMEYIANRIRINGDGKNYINSLLKTFRADRKLNIALSWNMFSWVNFENKLTVDGNEGILKIPYDMSHRDYLSCTKNKPGELCVGKAVYGAISKEWLIPAGVGVYDLHNQFMGSIIFGFDINSLIYKIERNIDLQNISLIIFDNQNKIVAQSFSGNFSKDFISNIIKEFPKADNQSTMISKQPLFKKSPNDILYHKLSKYPFQLLLIYNGEVSYQKFIALWSIRMLEFLIFMLATLVSLLVLYHKVINPLSSLSLMANKISLGNTDFNIKLSNIHEVSLLENQFVNIVSFIKSEKKIKKELADKTKSLEQAQHELESINNKLEQKVQERTQELEYALAAKTDFLNNMSHEIRTPITGMNIISSELIENWTQFSETKKIELANKVMLNAKRLNILVGNLLDLTKFSHGKMLLDFKKIDLSQLVANMIIESEALYLNGKNINFLFHSVCINEAIIDFERINQVLRNLFINAIKFSHNNSKIYINIKDSEIIYEDGSKVEALYLTIEDQGIGIPESELELIFGQFNQSSRTKGKSSGTGLGLAICREIIEAHSGKIWAETNNIGAKFNFLLPKFPTKKMKNHHIIAQNTEVHIQQVSDLSSAKIMIIDDEDTYLLSMELILSKTNYQLIKMNNGYEALDYLNSGNQIDLILLDLMMPELYGLNLLAELKGNSSLTDIPVILQTGSADELEIKKAFSMGAISYIKKPYNKNVILEEIAKALHARLYSIGDKNACFTKKFS